jgi:hypothetical protein
LKNTLKRYKFVKHAKKYWKIDVTFSHPIKLIAPAFAMHAMIRTVCAECEAVGHISHVPSLGACDLCLEQNRICVRHVVMVLCSDCEMGNKNAFEILNEKLENGTIDPALEFLCILPDCPHVGKSMKAAFSNWWLKCKVERINLGFLRTLRNRSGNTTKDRFRKLIPKTTM